MRLWSLHPKYLDTKGLVAAWREALLAQAVIRGQTRGYRHHPQLQRFQEQASPRLAINGFLFHLHAEALVRGYRFDASKIGPQPREWPCIAVGDGQVRYEWEHLMAKLAVRAPDLHCTLETVRVPELHPLFVKVRGPVASWERP